MQQVVYPPVMRSAPFVPMPIVVVEVVVEVVSQKEKGNCSCTSELALSTPGVNSTL